MNAIARKREKWGRKTVLLVSVSMLLLGTAISAITGVLPTTPVVTCLLVAASVTTVALTVWYSRKCPSQNV